MDLSYDKTAAVNQPSPLVFSGKYDREKAELYFRKHEYGLRRRLSHWREVGMARRALAIAGNPGSVLDIPCGTGRFWAMLTERPDRIVYAADLNSPMLNVATTMRPSPIVSKVKPFLASAFKIPVRDGFVEAVFCMRLIHHMQDTAHRVELIRELGRVASKTVMISLWTDNNFQAWRRRKVERRKPPVNRFIVPRSVIQGEFRQCGMDIVGQVDFMKYYSMWTTYVLAKTTDARATPVPS